jgi:hypothetical protein
MIDGMTLRDYFAIHATKEDYSDYRLDYSKSREFVEFNPWSNQSYIAKEPGKRSIVEARYLFADAMIRERGKNEAETNTTGAETRTDCPDEKGL